MAAGGKSNIHSTAPDAFAVVYTFNKEKTSIGVAVDMKADFATTEVILCKDILSIQTNKGKGGAGGFTISLGSSRNYKALLHSGCWIAIYMRDFPYSDGELKSVKNAKDSGLKMMGIVKSVRCVEGLGSGGQRFVRYDIQGEDFHTIFESKIYISSLFRMLKADSVVGMATSYYLLGKLYSFAADHSPTSLAKELVAQTFGWDVAKRANPKDLNKGSPALGGTMGLPPSFADRLNLPKNPEGNFKDAVIVHGQKDLGGRLAIQPSVGDEFTIWSLIKAYSNPTVNECYTDMFVTSEGIKPGMVIRAIPFSTKAKTYKMTANDHGTKTVATVDSSIQLVISKEIYDHEIVSLNYGKSDGERFNFFWISSGLSTYKNLKTIELIKNVANGDIINMSNPASIARYGLRPYMTTAPYIHEMKDARVLNDIVKDMWGDAHLFENGQVTIVGTTELIPVGTTIKFMDRKWIAHVEAVTHHYHVGGDGVKEFMTTLTFVRLQNEKQEPVDSMDRRAQREFDRGVTHSEGNDE